PAMPVWSRRGACASRGRCGCGVRTWPTQPRLVPVDQDALLVALDPGAVSWLDVHVGPGTGDGLGPILHEIADPARDDVLVVDLRAAGPAIGLWLDVLVPAPSRR